MISRVNAGAILSLLIILAIGVGAQNPQPTPLEANPKFGEGVAASAANGVVKSLNGKTGDLTLQAGSNITITPSGNTLTVSASNALTAVAHDATLTGNGTTSSPLSVVSAESQQESFYASKSFAEFGTNSSGMLLGTVPAGKRLVIDHISGTCYVPAGETVTELFLFLSPMGGAPQQLHYLIPVFTGALPGIGHRYAWSQSVRFIVDSGTEVQIAALKTTFVGFGACSGFIAGHLVDKP